MPRRDGGSNRPGDEVSYIDNDDCSVFTFNTLEKHQKSLLTKKIHLNPKNNKFIDQPQPAYQKHSDDNSDSSSSYEVNESGNQDIDWSSIKCFKVHIKQKIGAGG